RQAEVVGGYLPHLGAEPLHGRRERRADKVAGGFHARRHHGRHAVAPVPDGPFTASGAVTTSGAATGSGALTGSEPLAGSVRRDPPGPGRRPAGGIAARPRTGPADAAGLARRPVPSGTASPWRSARAAFKPLRTAPSIVSGHPVSVQAPASTSPGRAVAA